MDYGAHACDHIWRGTVALGKSCQSSEECAPVDFEFVACTANELTGTKTCTASPRAPRGSRGEACAFTCPAGGSCEAPADLNNLPGDTQAYSICFMDEGLFCSPTGVCVPVVERGGDCSRGEACVSGAYCDSATVTCKALKGEDAPCTNNGECESRSCLSRNDTSPRRCTSADLASAEVCSEDFSRGSSGPPPNGL